MNSAKFLEILILEAFSGKKIMKNITKSIYKIEYNCCYLWNSVKIEENVIVADDKLCNILYKN